MKDVDALHQRIGKVPMEGESRTGTPEVERRETGKKRGGLMRGERGGGAGVWKIE